MSTKPNVLRNCEGCPLATEEQIKICEGVARKITQAAMFVDPAFEHGVKQGSTTTASIILSRQNLAPEIYRAAQTACEAAQQEISKPVAVA